MAGCVHSTHIPRPAPAHEVLAREGVAGAGLEVRHGTKKNSVNRHEREKTPSTLSNKNATSSSNPKGGKSSYRKGVQGKWPCPAPS